MHRAYEDFVTAGMLRPYVRPVIADSWRRCTRAAGALATGLPPVRLGAGELRELRDRHPLAPLLPMITDLLGSCTDDGHVLAVTDAGGTLLWVRGHPGTLRRAERMNFVEGAAWAESLAGTNAPGTALAIAAPVQVATAEHLNAAVQPWSCAATPVRDPSGQILGALDLTGRADMAGPQALALVRATGRAVEAELARRLADERTRQAYLLVGGLDRIDPGAPALRIVSLGRDTATVVVDGRSQQLRPRHSEILVLLALAGPAGLSGGRLAVELAETDVAGVTVRAEMSRLRARLGADLLDSQPYRLRRTVEADFLNAGALVRLGRVRDALALYSGPLLPASQAPAVVDARMALERELRTGVLASADAAVLRHWVNTPWGARDAQIWRRLADLLPGGSLARSMAAAQARDLGTDGAATLWQRRPT